MFMHVRQSGYSTQEHYIRQITTTSLSIRTIIAIGVCGGLGLLAILLLILYFVKRGKQRKEKRKESLGELDEEEEIRRAIRSTRPPDLDLGQRRSYLQYFGNKKKPVRNPWVDEDGLHGPQMANAKPFTPRNESGDSQNGWQLMPLTNPLALPNSQLVVPEGPHSPSDSYPVISPPGVTAVPAPSYAKGRSYNAALGARDIDVIGIPRSTIRYVPYEPQKIASKRRSISDNHLTSILRSTSQRMRDRRASQRPLSRAHSVLSQISGVPPSQRLPSPPRNNFGGNGYGDSREGLIDTREKGRPGSAQSYDTLNYEAILDDFHTRRTPSPSKSVPWSADHVTGKRSRSASAASDEDSLCNGKTPDFVIPFYLTSPSKRQPNNVRTTNGGENPVRVLSEESPKSAIETSIRIQKDSRASIQAFGYFDQAIHQKRLLTKSKDLDNDPFYSGVVKSGRSTTRVNQILMGPRSPPVKSYMPKRGHSRKASTLSKSFLSLRPGGADQVELPLGDISGNINQDSPIKFRDRPERASKLDAQLANFQWSPEPTHLARKTSISSIGPGVARQHHQGHKRQNVVRMSGLPRPRSVCPVPEESEDLNYDDSFSTSRLDLSKVPTVPPLLNSTESLARSASLASSVYSRHNMIDSAQPPSSSVFEPRLKLLSLNRNVVHESISMNSMGSSPTLGPHHANLNMSTQTSHGYAYTSPSMGAYNHCKAALTEDTDETTDDFSGSPLKTKRFPKSKSRRIGRNFSIDCGTVAAKGPAFTFPPPTPALSSHTIDDPFSHANTFSFPLSVPSPTTTLGAHSHSAPPLITRLHSPHSPQRLLNSSDILLRNITQLRRSNSTLSSYSMNSMGSTLTIGLGEKDESSLILADLRGGGTSPNKRGSGYLDGNKNYMNLSNPNSTSSSPSKQASSVFTHTTTQAFQSSSSLGGRNYSLSSRSNATSPFKSAPFEEVAKIPALGRGIGASSFKSQQIGTGNEGKAFKTTEHQPDLPTKTLPSRKLKSLRKSGKSCPQQGNENISCGLISSPPHLSAPNPERDTWAEESKHRSFKFENYSQQHFESLRFTTASRDDEDEGYGEDGEDLNRQKGNCADEKKMESNAAPTERFQFQEIQKFVGDQHQSFKSAASFSDSASIPGLKLCQQQPATAKNELGAGWELHSQSKATLAPSLSMAMAITPSISPTQLCTRFSFPNSSAEQSTAQLHSTPVATTKTNKNTEILSPIPMLTSSSHSQILQAKQREHGILHLNYAKTSRWIFEETTPKVSPSPSPDRQMGDAPAKKMYKAHSRNQSYSQNHSKHGGSGIERRMGNPLSSNPTVSSLMMASELGMKEPRIIDLDEAMNFTPAHSRVSNIENLDPETQHTEDKVEIEERDITEAATTTTNLNLKPRPSTPTSPTKSASKCIPAACKDSTGKPPNPISQSQDDTTALNENESSKSDEPGKNKKDGSAKGNMKTKTIAHFENIFSRHHRGHMLHEAEEGLVVYDKRGSFYDQEGFLKSSPAVGATADGVRNGRGWSMRAKK